MDEKNILSNQDEFFQKLNAAILKNIDNTKYSLDQLCEDCLVSRSQLHRKIKEQTGLSTTIYIRTVKLQKAKELLQDSKLSVSEIAYETGFSSPQTLSRYFSENYKISPSQFRTKSLNQKLEPGNQLENQAVNSDSAYQQTNKIDSIDQQDEPSLEKINSESYIEKDVEEDLYRVEFEKPISKNRMPLFITILTVPILALATFWIYKTFKTEGRTIESTKQRMTTSFYNNSIAVLPFLNLGSADNEQFCGGIQEDILTKLTFFKDLKVISRTSVATYKDTKKPIKQIGSELGVAYILEGSVRMHEDQVAITAQLIRSSDGYHVWAENYIRKVDDVFKIQNEISLKIAEILNQKISAKTESKITNAYQPTKEAYTKYLIGKKLIEDRTHTSLLASIERFDEALAIDSNFVDAIVFKANAFQLLGNIGYDRSKEYINTSQKLSFEALKLDSNNAQAYAILACNYSDAHQWDQAKITFEIALERSPNDPLINYWYSLNLREMGEMEDAVIYSHKARELDPLYPVIHGGHIVNLAYADKTEEAKAVIKEGDVLFQQSFMHHWAKAIFAESIFDYPGAIAAFEKVLEINPELSSVQNGILFNKARLGYKDEVLGYINKIEKNTGADLFAKATLYAGLEDADQSANYILQAMDKGVYPSDILVDKNYDFLRSHEKYHEILDKYNLLEFNKRPSKEITN